MTWFFRNNFLRKGLGFPMVAGSRNFCAQSLDFTTSILTRFNVFSMKYFFIYNFFSGHKNARDELISIIVYAGKTLPAQTFLYFKFKKTREIYERLNQNKCLLRAKRFPHRAPMDSNQL